ncbi:MAG: enolase C-terminal domain-like protein [Planctomycetota bacterium]
MKSLPIADVRVICTAPMGRNLVIAKVVTEEPELYGLGCGTFTQRFEAVAAALEHHLKPLVIGRDALRTEELWRLMHFNGYWRSGPVLNNAISAIDMALWDLKAKVAGLPLYQLLGGKVREGCAIYRHADGPTPEALAEHVREHLRSGVRHVRLRLGGGANETYANPEAGGLAYGGINDDPVAPPDGALPGAYYDPRCYVASTLDAFAYIRQTFGDGVELLHDVHGRLTLAEAMHFAKNLEKFRPYFLEDPLPPEDFTAYPQLRAHTSVPIAASELLTHPTEWLPLVRDRLIDFIRMHVSDLGGLTPARKAATVAEAFGVQTAWHGPGDCSPVGHAVNLHLNLASPNFGVQELQPFTESTENVFPGCPQLRSGYLYPNDKPGHGVDLNEALASDYPCKAEVPQWSQARRPDGSLNAP